MQFSILFERFIAYDTAFNYIIKDIHCPVFQLRLSFFQNQDSEATERQANNGGVDDGKSQPESSADSRGTPKGKTPVTGKARVKGNRAGLDAKVDKVVMTLESRVAEFSQATKDIKSLAESVKVLSADVISLKRKRSPELLEEPGPSSTKQVHFSDSNPLSDTPSGSDSESEDSDCELDGFIQQKEEQEKTPEEGFDELDSYFEPQDGVGEEVGEQIGKITERALRGNKEKKDGEKLTDLKKKYLRPKNIPNLQVPRVDDILWRQLKREVRSVDFQMQKANASYCQALIPIIKAMGHLKDKEFDKAGEYVTDAFKILCLNTKANIAGRRERIIKELQPKFKSICQNEASASNLFGDNFTESVKKLESTKSSLTTSAQNSFLGKKGGRFQTHYQSRSYNKGYNWNHNQRPAPHKFDRKTNATYRKRVNTTRK